jgi:small nuclear ribonucleoprotein (snRNP)-like protein
MELIKYLGLKVYITLSNGFYYRGKVIDADENSITLIDKNDKKVSITKEIIQTITEIQ